ncbi:SgcJ/EcaC family oxidoreductase [Paenibacillus silviterrae]|uniref:SgcJ/EcaC family oxidoreductase n=1 Tax=Paenibacillus silviterrae TaxID=3242194 RepID=UPI002543F05E|nr:SgcJ/EcaC family oxidoreductase [Paenibacillus chinjuensis]
MRNNRNTEETQAIAELFFRLKQAWDDGDAAAYGSCFTEEADYVTFQGEHLQGRQAITDVHQALWQGVLKGSKLVGEIKKIRMLTTDFAVFHGVGAVKLRWQKTAPPKRDSINTNVVVKQQGEWKIAAFQNSRISEPGLVQRLFTKFSK